MPTGRRRTASWPTCEPRWPTHPPVPALPRQRRPGAHALDTYGDDAERLGAGRVLITGPAPAEPGPALTTEHSAPVLAMLKLPGDPRQFLAEAVRTTNEEFAGTLA
ncbi:hypothetical protein [Streptomyces sp. AK08-02]|uniref:hypothetical protein n=1 Tax=Streptomyces sp. AK08-02 TaxID=3028654 RepID=UPI0029B449D4|nr:hypothetical protein [Streptomyces sp. AK08-02]MDX3746529.1 hypothetical protein [Streptomyces sp. AK08-02]